MKTERAIEVLESLRHPIRNGINLQNVEVEDIQQALDKAIEAMGIDYTQLINEVEDYYEGTTNSDEYKEGIRNACSMIDFRIKLRMLNIVDSLPEHEIWTELSDKFREVAHLYKDGKLDYRCVWDWFQQQQKHYKLERQ